VVVLIRDLLTDAVFAASSGLRGAASTPGRRWNAAIFAALRGVFLNAEHRDVHAIRRQLDWMWWAELPRRRVASRRMSAGGVPAVELLPANAGRTILFLHGGGYAVGSTASHAVLMADLALAAQARVIGLDYRLAPEHPFPAALEDARAAWRWLMRSGTAPDRVVLVGDSAGGGLAVILAADLAARGEAQPAGVVTLSPWVDLTLSGASVQQNAHRDFIAVPERIGAFGRAYAGGLPLDHPGLSPALHPLPRIAPLLIHVGTAEILLDDARRLARRATEAGVHVTLEEWPDMVHVWHAMTLLVPEAREAVERVGAWVREVAPDTSR
jgi:monoterpene epsilon-lactone hydrolase